MQRFHTLNHTSPTRRKITANTKVFAKHDILKNVEPRQTLMGAFHALSYTGTEGTANNTSAGSKTDLKEKYEQVFRQDDQIQSLRAQL